jgi:hypothetical protein
VSEVFREFPESLQANTGVILRLGHNRILPNPFQFTIHLLSYHSEVCSLATDSLVKFLTTNKRKQQPYYSTAVELWSVLSQCETKDRESHPDKQETSLHFLSPYLTQRLSSQLLPVPRSTIFESSLNFITKTGQLREGVDKSLAL